MGSNASKIYIKSEQLGKQIIIIVYVSVFPPSSAQSELQGNENYSAPTKIFRLVEISNEFLIR